MKEKNIQKGNNGCKQEKFNEDLLFELHKDHPFDTAREFKYFIKKKYHIDCSSDLVKRIINYQINTYGEQRFSGNDPYPVDMDESKNLKSFKNRVHAKDYQVAKKRERKFVERNGGYYG